MVLKLGIQPTNFWVLNIDTILITCLLISGIFVAALITIQYCTWRNPGYLQTGLEMLFELFENGVANSYGKKDKTLITYGFSLFTFILSCNLMDIIPSSLSYFIGYNFINKVKSFRLVPTEDLNTTAALAFLSFIVIIYYNIKDLGIITYLKHILFEPFGMFLLPYNFAYHLIEQLSRPFSLALRLYGNMFAGGILFTVISIFPPYLVWFFYLLWSVLHAPTLLIQAIIFPQIVLGAIPPKNHTSNTQINKINGG
jgi:F-type H+-transporting ATPase subunit a